MISFAHQVISAILALVLVSTSGTTDDPPNIVLFYVDDLGWRDVGFNGSRFYETPAIDSLAAQGIVFTNAYANAPNCAPSRASLLSGLYTPRHKVYTVAPAARGREEDRKLDLPESRTDLDLSFVTLAEILGHAGYATGHFGKWHLGSSGHLPTDQGFDVNVAGFQRGSPPGGYFPPYKNPHLSDGPEGEYLTDRLTDEAVAFISENRDQPFFLYLPHYAVHTPIQSRPELAERYEDKPADRGQDNATYAGMIESTDQSMARVLERLEAHGLSENTIVIFYSDNGGHVGATSNQPLRGFKGMLYEGGIRVPLAVRWPARIEAGQHSSVPVIGTDLFPTLVAAAGASRPSLLDGVDISPVWSGDTIPERPIFWHFPAYLEAGRRTPGPWRTTPAGAVRRGDFKLIEFFEDGRLELYDLSRDVSETTNLASVQPDRARELHDILKAWRNAIDADMPTPK